MREKRDLILTVQYVIFSVLSVFTVLLPYVKLSLTITLLEEKTVDRDLTGWELIRCLSGLNKLLGSELSDKIEFVKKYSVLFMVMIVVFVIIPLLISVVGGIVHAFMYYRRKLSRKLAIIPGTAGLLMAAGQISFYTLFRLQIKAWKSQLSDGVSSLLGKTLADNITNTVSGGIGPQFGFFLFVLCMLLLLLSDLFFFDLGKELSRPAGKLQDTGGDEGRLPDNKHRVPNFDKNEGRKKHTITTWTNSDLFDNSSASSGPGVYRNKRYSQIDRNASFSSTGMLMGIRGEYQGAKISMYSGEIILLGRGSECNLILSDGNVSRRHCRISYNAQEDDYTIINDSLNGTYLSTGEKLEKGKAYHLKRGTGFFVNDKNEFRVL